MALEDLAQVVISTEGPALTQVGFGTLACAAYHTKNTDFSRTYTALSQVTGDGFATYDAAYRMVQRAFQQNPRPTSVKVIRLQTPCTQHVKFTPVSATNNTIYGYTVNYKGVSYDVTYTSDGTATVAEIVTGLATAFEALDAAISGHATAAASDTNTRSSITADTAGDIFYFSNWTKNLKFEDVTADPGIAADLDAIRAVDNDWYGLAIDQNANLVIQAAAGWAEAQTVLAAFNTADSDAFDDTKTNDVGFQLKNISIGRSMVAFDLDTTAGYMGVAMLAERFPKDPGAAGAGGTFAFKTLVGVSGDALTPTQQTNLRNKNYVTYITTAGRNHTLDGKVAGGEFADVVRGLDWYRIRSEERIAALLLNNDKIPFTDRGISQVYGELRAQQLTAEDVELFRPGSTTLVAPKASDVAPNDRAARKLTGFQGSATLAGAIHLVAPISITVGS